MSTDTKTKFKSKRFGREFPIRAGQGADLYEGLALLTKKDRLALKAAIEEGKKAIPGGWN